MYLNRITHRSELFDLATRWWAERPRPGDGRFLNWRRHDSDRHAPGKTILFQGSGPAFDLILHEAGRNTRVVKFRTLDSCHSPIRWSRYQASTLPSMGLSSAEEIEQANSRTDGMSVRQKDEARWLEPNT